MWKHPGRSTSIAPVIGGIGLVGSTVLGIINFDTPAGTGSGVTGGLPWLYLDRSGGRS